MSVSGKGKLSLRNRNFKIFSGNANIKLTQDICKYLKVPLSPALVSKFSNGEIRVKIEENVRGMEVFVIQPTCRPVNDSLMELLIIIDALSRASAKQITAVIPYYGYAKQEKKTAGREPITAKLVANLLTIAGANRIITIDLHAAAIQGFFDIPVDNLYAMPILLKYIKKQKLDKNEIVVVSPDAGGVARARAFAERLNATLAIIFKRRPEPDVSELIEVVGRVKGKTAIIVDDMISTGSTLVTGAKTLIKRGAKKVYACITHPVLANKSIKLIDKSPLIEMVVTDTIPIEKSKRSKKITVLSVASLLGEAIIRNHFHISVSKLFD